MSRRLDTTRTPPDILDCIANLSSDEVFTPPRLVNQMLDLLPKDVWTNPDLKWLDPTCKTGVFLREVARRLMDHLSEAIPAEDARREHVYKNMLYGLPITELTGLLSRRSVYYSKNADHERYAVVRMGSAEGNIPFVETKHSFRAGSCVQCGAPEMLERGDDRENYAYPFIHPEQLPKGFKEMKFDVIVGNPPYQIGVEGNTRDKPIYNLFVEAAIKMEPKHVVMITPSRWFSGGLGLDGYRARMLRDPRIRRLVDYVDATDCFPGVDIQGGVSFFHWDASWDGPCMVADKTDGSEATRFLSEFDVFVRSNAAVSIIRKVSAKDHGTLADQVSSRVPFGISTTFSDTSDVERDNDVALFRRNQQKVWVSRNTVTNNTDWVSQWKTLIPVAYGERGKGPYFVIGKPFVTGPSSACTDTYLVCGSYASPDAAENLAAFLRTRFVRLLISLRKTAQHVTKDRFSFVPLLDMSIAWTDEMLFDRYDLSEDEILFIKSQIKEMS